MPRKPATSKKSIRSSEVIIQSTVRPQEEAVMRFSGKRAPMDNLVRRYQKWVKVGVSRNANGVGRLPVRCYRAASKGGSKSCWRGKRVGLKASNVLRKHAGPLSTKAMDYDEELEEITDPTHPVNALMRTINPFCNGGDWLKDTIGAGCLTGNAYTAVITGANGWPVEMWNLPPQYCKVQPDRSTLIGGYWYGRGTEVERFYKAEDIIHLRQPNPRGDPYYGFGDLEACTPDADLSFALSQVSLAILDNGIMPGLIFVGEEWTKDQRTEARAHMEREHQGVAKIGRAMFLSGKVKVDKVQIGQHEVALLQGADDHAREVVAACLDVPLELMTLRAGGLSDGQNVAMRQWEWMGLLPRKQNLEDKLNEKLMPMFRGPLNDESLVLCIDSPVQEDLEASEKRVVSLFMGNIVFRDEARSMLQLDPVDGEEPVWQAALSAPAIPVGAVPADGEAVATGGGSPEQIAADSGAAVQDTALNGAQVSELRATLADIAAGKLPFEMGLPFIRASFPLIPEDQIINMLAPLKTFEPKPDPVEVARAEAAQNPPKPPDDTGVPDKGSKEWIAASAMVQNSVNRLMEKKGATKIPHLFDPVPWLSTENIERKDDDYARRFQAALQDWFRTVADPEVRSRIARYIESSMIEPVRDILASNPEIRDSFVQAIAPFTREAMGAGNVAAVGQLANAGRVGDAEDWANVPPKAAIEWLAQNDVRLADSTLATLDARVRDSVGRALSDSVAAGLEQGDTIAQIQANVSEVMSPTSTQFAAERIARTSSAEALSAGRDQTYRESGEVVAYRWLLSGDPCPMCRELADKVVPVGQPFGAGAFGPVMYPPAHPNCSCDYTPVFKDSLDAA